MNRFWIVTILLSIMYSIVNQTTFELMDVLTSVGKETLDYVLPLVANVAFFSGVLEVAKDNGLLKKFEYLVAPFLHWILPDLKNESEVNGYIATNIVMNMFGLGSAATPSGLMAMKEMQKKNKQSKVATRPMITFVVLNTAGVTLFNTTILSLRSQFNSVDSAKFMPFSIVVTVITCIFALLLDRILNYGHK